MTLAASSPASGPQVPIPPGQPPRPATSLRAVSLVSGLTAVQLLIQFAMQVAMARYFGAGAEVDAFVAALAAPTVLSTIMSASLGYVLVPLITEALRNNEPQAASQVATQIGCGLTAIALLVAVVVAALATPLTKLLCPGFADSQIALTAGLLQILSPLIVANCLISLLNALHHAWRQFALPAVAGVAGTGVTLAYLLLFHAQQGVAALAWGTVVGSLVAIALMSRLVAAQFDMATALSLELHRGTRRAAALLTPLILGALYWRLDPLLDRFLGSFLEAGSIAHLGYSWRLVSGLMLIGTSGLSIVAFPAIAAHAAAGRPQELAAELAHALRFFLALMIPIAVGVSVFAVPVVRLLFEHGRFTAADSQAVALLVVLYAGVILGAGLGDLFSRTSYALQDMRTPVVVSVVAFTIAAILKVLLVRPWGAAGIVAATSFYSLLNIVILAWLLAARLSLAIVHGTAATTAKALAASALACAAAAVVLQIPTPWAVLPAAAAGALAYFAIMLVFKDEFAVRAAQWLWRKGSR